MRAVLDVLIFDIVGASLFLGIVWGLGMIRKDGYRDGYAQCLGERDE
jgi:hypothetical protein